MTNILEIKNLNVGFNIDINNEDKFFYALNDINLSFKLGEVCFIVQKMVYFGIYFGNII